LEPKVAPEVGFATELAGALAVPPAVAFDAGPDGELWVEPVAGLGADDVGLVANDVGFAAEFVDAAGLGV
jgi:hypothetical protein